MPYDLLTLTRPDGKPVFIRADHVTAIEDDTPQRTRLLFANGKEHAVKETPIYIAGLINSLR